MMKPFPQTAADWRSSVQANAELLEVCLSSVPDWGQCPACERAYPNSLASHIAGKDHWKKLWWKWWKAEQKEPLRQAWHNATGTVIFDHLSGEVTRTEVTEAREAPIPATYTAEATPPEPFLRAENGALALLECAQPTNATNDVALWMAEQVWVVKHC